MIRVAIVAAYASVRAGLHAIFSAETDMQIAGDAPHADALRQFLPNLAIDVILLDTTGMSSAADAVGGVLRVLSTSSPAPAALVIVGDAPEDDLRRLASANLSGWGYLLQEAEGRQIVGAVRAAAVGLIALDPSLSLAALESPASSPPRSAGDDAFPGDALTPREIEVLNLMAEGLPNKIIAVRLRISIHTAKFHVAQILGKLDAASRTEAVTIGARRGYVTL